MLVIQHIYTMPNKCPIVLTPENYKFHNFRFTHFIDYEEFIFSEEFITMFKDCFVWDWVINFQFKYHSQEFILTLL